MAMDSPETDKQSKVACSLRTLHQRNHQLPTAAQYQRTLLLLLARPFDVQAHREACTPHPHAAQSCTMSSAKAVYPAVPASKYLGPPPETESYMVSILVSRRAQDLPPNAT